MANPDTGEGFDAPLPSEAYKNAPELRAEIHAVMELGAARDGRRAGMVTVPPACDDTAAERAYLLRRAALMDRMAMDDPDLAASQAAAKTAGELAQFDQQHPEHVAGPHGPASIEFDPSQRPYIRQEYAAWSAIGRPGSTD